MNKIKMLNKKTIIIRYFSMIKIIIIFLSSYDIRIPKQSVQKYKGIVF